MTTYSVFDSDNHLYEPQDALTRHLPKEYRNAVDYVEVRGRTKIVINGTISNFIPNPTFPVVAAPGVQEEYFRIGNPEGKPHREILGQPIKTPPSFQYPAPRIELMNEQGLDRTLLFPTLASLLEERLREHPDATHAVIHSLNQWLHEEWTFNYEDRIFTAPIITLPIVDKAIEELEWVVERGAKHVLIRPAPAWGLRGPRSFALPEFDPFWAKVVEADILVSMHASDSGYSRFINEWAGSQEYLPFQPDPFRMAAMGKRAIEDTVISMTCHGLLTRFPTLRIALIENGADWVLPVFKKLDETYRRMPQMFEEHPVDAFKRNVWVSPFHEDDISSLIGELGIDRLMFGSDYPHAEGLAEPTSYVNHLPDGLADDDVAKIMGANLATILKVAA